MSDVFYCTILFSNLPRPLPSARPTERSRTGNSENEKKLPAKVPSSFVSSQWPLVKYSKTVIQAWLFQQSFASEVFPSLTNMFINGPKSSDAVLPLRKISLLAQRPRTRYAGKTTSLLPLEQNSSTKQPICIVASLDKGQPAFSTFLKFAHMLQSMDCIL
jgi:hypothetical protein